MRSGVLRAAAGVRGLARRSPSVAAGLAVLALFFFYAVQRNLATMAGYRLGRLQEEHRRLLNQNHHLRWSLIRSVPREALEARARASGLRVPRPSEEILIVVDKEGD
jgi:hypothetical protein